MFLGACSIFLLLCTSVSWADHKHSKAHSPEGICFLNFWSSPSWCNTTLGVLPLPAQPKSGFTHLTAQLPWLSQGSRVSCDGPHKPHGWQLVTLLSWWRSPSVLGKASIFVCIVWIQKHAGQLSCINHCTRPGVKAKGFCTSTAGQIQPLLIPKGQLVQHLVRSSSQSRMLQRGAQQHDGVPRAGLHCRIA